ncbi:MAG TPA: metallopeptidase TldD-related protein, partial [Gemmatimonadaceae bacterium]|nr:metallopeptidase TldD-related protein [Gemmatimonadaceae bacterium]
KIDTRHLSAIALDKCLTSRNPVAIEPGRHTTILEPQAVCDFVGQLIHGVFTEALDKACSVGTCGDSRDYPFNKTQAGGNNGPGLSRLGDRVVDERITISADPMDPELGFPPFFPNAEPMGRNSVSDWIGQNVFHPTTWIKDGVLTALEYGRDSFIGSVGPDTGLGVPNSGAFRMSGGTTSIDEMIQTTRRGLLVTRLDRIQGLDLRSLLLRGYTRDGLWLVENGKISKPVKNFMFVESILFALNNVEQVGVPQRVYHPATGRLAIPQPVIVPPLKIKDFSFTALVDAV